MVSGFTGLELSTVEGRKMSGLQRLRDEPCVIKCVALNAVTKVTLLNNQILLQAFSVSSPSVRTRSIYLSAF